jgi:hypothetical protein
MNWKLPPGTFFEVAPPKPPQPQYSWDNPPPIEPEAPAFKEPETQEEFAAHIFTCAQEHFVRNGVKVYAIEARDRVSLLKLYAEIKGFIGAKAAPAQQSFVSNEMRVTLVKPDHEIVQEPKVVKQIEDEPTNVTPLRIKAV